jgi:hypothetical protein
MKRRELLQHTACDYCGEKIGHTGRPMFWTGKIQWHGLKGDAIRRHTGLEMMLGNPALAAVMGPDEEMTIELNTAEFTLCDECGNKHIMSLMMFMKENQQEETDV